MVLKDKNHYDINNSFFFSGCPDGFYEKNCAYNCSEHCEDLRGCADMTGGCYGINYSD